MRPAGSPSELPKGCNSLLQKMTYNLSGGKPDVGFTAVGRRTEERELYMDWSEYTTGYTTSAEYPLIRAHSRAGPVVE